MAPGPRNLLTDVPGLSVGQAHDDAVRTGVTVILPDQPAIGAVDVRGGGPGTRETDLLNPETMVEAVDAMVLSGGSVHGLAAADAVCARLAAAGRGFRFPQLGPDVPTAPIVPAAILFDLANGGDKGWGEESPYRRLGATAFAAVDRTFALGSAGAGFGARSGRLKGGVGSASIVTDDGVTIGALAAVNSFGSTVADDGATFWAAPFEIGGEFGGLGSGGLSGAAGDWTHTKAGAAAAGQNTTLAVVALDLALTKVECRRIAMMAQDGLARAIRPVHAPFDGDVVFVLALGQRPVEGPRPLAIARLGALAADVVARSIARGVYVANLALP